MDQLLFAGLVVVVGGVLMAMFGVWQVAQSAAARGKPTAPGRRTIYYGSALTVAGFGLMFLGISDFAVVKIIGVFLLGQAAAMVFLSGRIRQLR